MKVDLRFWLGSAESAGAVVTMEGAIKGKCQQPHMDDFSRVIGSISSYLSVGAESFCLLVLLQFSRSEDRIHVALPTC